MSDHIITGAMLVVAIIHLVPLSGVFGADRLAALYGFEVADRNLEILMRHRAVLFAILGTFFAYAAFEPTLQPTAFVAAFVSLASFFYLSASVGGFNEAIRRIVVADVVAAVALAVAVILYLL